VQRGIVEETLYKEGRKWLDLGRREKGHRERTESGYCYAIWLAQIEIIQKWNGGTIEEERRFQAYIRRLPLGSGISRPNSFAVSSQRSIASWQLARASSGVRPWAAQPGSSGTSAMNAWSSLLQ